MNLILGLQALSIRGCVRADQLFFAPILCSKIAGWYIRDPVIRRRVGIDNCLSELACGNFTIEQQVEFLIRMLAGFWQAKTRPDKEDWKD